MPESPPAICRNPEGQERVPGADGQQGNLYNEGVNSEGQRAHLATEGPQTEGQQSGEFIHPSRRGGNNR
jgi:hypothetical protein